MTTFSQLVDDLCVELVRPDLRPFIAASLNQVIRELHFDEKTEMPVHFGSNRYEVETLSLNPQMAVWPIPVVTRFQFLEAIFLPEYGEYAIQRNPRRVFEVEDNTNFYWYRTGPAIAIGGVAPVTHAKISWFEYLPNLENFPSGGRPATYDPVAENWSYYTVGGVNYALDDASMLRALELTTNWMILRWATILKAGVRNKVYIRLGDEIRARTTYSIYSTGRRQVINSEALNLESHR